MTTGFFSRSTWSRHFDFSRTCRTFNTWKDSITLLWMRKNLKVRMNMWIFTIFSVMTVSLCIRRQSLQSAAYSRGRRTWCVVTESQWASAANPKKKCHPCLEQKPRKTLCLRVRPQGSIPTFFFFFTGKWKSLLWLLWRFPAVFSYFMTWWKAPLLFLRHKDENKRNVGEIFFKGFACMLLLFI